MTSGWDGSGTVGRRRIQTCPPGPPLLDWLPGTTRELTSNLYLTAETTMSEASGKFWVKVYFFNVSDCCSSFNLNTIICIFFILTFTFWTTALQWEMGTTPSDFQKPPPFEKNQITRWCLGSLHPPVVILVNMMTRCGGYCSISAHPPAGPHYMWIIYWILSSFPPKLISPEKRAATAAATTTTASVAAFPFP